MTIRKLKEEDCDIVTGTRYNYGGGVSSFIIKNVLKDVLIIYEEII